MVIVIILFVGSLQASLSTMFAQIYAIIKIPRLKFLTMHILKDFYTCFFISFLVSWAMRILFSMCISITVFLFWKNRLKFKIKLSLDSRSKSSFFCRSSKNRIIAYFKQFSYVIALEFFANQILHTLLNMSILLLYFLFCSNAGIYSIIQVITFVALRYYSRMKFSIFFLGTAIFPKPSNSTNIKYTPFLFPPLFLTYINHVF